MNNWKFVKLNECCEILDNRRIPINSEERSKRKPIYPYYGANGLQGFIDSFIFDEDLVLIAEDGGYFDEWESRPISYIVRGKSWVNNHAHVLKAKSNTITEWIHYNLVHRNIIKFINGGTRAKLNQADLREIPIFLPPLNEQKKIAEILTSADKVIELTSMEINKLKDLKKGMMQELLTKGIGHTKFKDSPVGRIPESWEVKIVEEFAKVGTGERDTQDKIEGGEYPFYVRSEKVERINSYSFDGTAVLTVGDGVGTGKVFHYVEGKVEIHQRVYKIFNFRGEIIPKFFYYYFSRDFIKQVERFSAKASVESVRKEMITKMAIPIPPINEQNYIVNILDSIASRLSKDEIKLENFNILKKGLMQDLLTGKIRVPV